MEWCVVVFEGCTINVLSPFRYMYHYISDDGLVYLCITDDVSDIHHNTHLILTYCVSTRLFNAKCSQLHYSPSLV